MEFFVLFSFQTELLGSSSRGVISTCMTALCLYVNGALYQTPYSIQFVLYTLSMFFNISWIWRLRKLKNINLRCCASVFSAPFSHSHFICSLFFIWLTFSSYYKWVVCFYAKYYCYCFKLTERWIFASASAHKMKKKWLGQTLFFGNSI